MLKYLLTALALFGICSGQSIVLDSFNAGGTTGAVRAGTSWVGNTTQNATTLSVGGTARDDNGWGATNLTLNATGMNFITIVGQRDAGNVAGTLAIQFEDRNLNTQVFSIGTSAFAVGTLTSVQIPITNWTGGFAVNQIAGWSIGGGGVGTNAFRFTFDSLSLNSVAGSGTVAPSVTGSFGAQTKAAGESVSFSITATGTAPLTYQWSKNSSASLTANPTSTTATLTLTSLTPADAGTYSCTVTNAAGSVVSGTFSLTVTAQPATVTLGNLATVYNGAAQGATAVTSPANLPVVFSYNGSSAVPSAAGSYSVVATVNSPTYIGSASGTLVIARAAQAVAFAPLPTTLRVGTAFTLAATATSGGPVAFAVLTGNATIDGASLTPNSTAAITVRATQAGTTNYLPATTDLSFTTAKQTQSITFSAIADFAGAAAPITLSATATSTLPVSYSVVSGPAVVSGNTVTPTASGVITVRASQGGNDAFNAAPDVSRTFTATLPANPVTPPPVTPTEPTARLANFSTRARVGAGDQVAIAGFVIGGTDTKSVLVRAVGPTLANFGVTGVVPAPALELFRAGTATALVRNSGWSAGGAGPAIAAAATGAGAFALELGTADAALLSTLSPGNYSAVIGSADARLGVGLVEVYDLNESASSARISNLSVRAFAGSDADTLIVGLVVRGTATQRFLIRAIGPALTQFGVTGALQRPQLAVFTGSNEIARNVGWSTAADPTALSTAATQTGAFSLASGSADSAVLLTLSAGNHTAQVSGLGGTTGVALVEVYEVR